MRNLLPYEFFGNSQSKTLLIFIHGWPDTHRLWDNITSQLKNQYEILSLSYPGYHTNQKGSLPLAEIADRMKNTIEFIDQQHTRNRILVAHDWGAFFTYVMDCKYPKFVDDIITLDVSYYRNQQTKAKLFILAYQWWLIFAYLFWNYIPLIGPKIGDLMTYILAKQFKYHNPSNASASMNYHYLNIWKGILTNRIPLKPGYKPSVPIGYVYGKKKPAQFHNDKWFELLSSLPDSEYIEANTGHWISLEQPELVLDLIKKRTQRFKAKL